MISTVAVSEALLAKEVSPDAKTANIKSKALGPTCCTVCAKDSGKEIALPPPSRYLVNHRCVCRSLIANTTAACREAAFLSNGPP
jgi:hypothetical protein